MDYVIIGGDAAGMSAAMQIVRRDNNANVTTLEMGGIYSYAQCGLPYYIGGLTGDRDDLIARTRDTFEHEYGIDARVYHKVTKVDPDRKTVSGTNLKTDESFELSYDKCLIATGAAPVMPDLQGTDLDGIHTLKTIPDAETIMEDMSADVLDVTIIGGGYIGLELAENLVEKNKKVRIIDHADRLGSAYDPEISAEIEKEAHRKGIAVQTGEGVVRFEGTSRVQQVVTDKESYNTDMVVVAVGVTPNTEMVDRTRVHTMDNGAIIVNSYMETNVPDLYAAGDCATQYHRIKAKNDYQPLGTHANKQGRIAGMNMCGVAQAFQGIVGTSIMKFFDLTIGKTGIGEQEADEMNFKCDCDAFKGHSHAGYYPDNEPMLMKVVSHQVTGHFLGLQAVGRRGVDKRIDVAATALYHKMTMADIENLDLSYAPPYNGVWDPLQQASRRVK
ncbi:FAD-dependent oxidoreductase [Alteribacter natronophilus]|uniref:FAD-dependent oxidoreductase n=1 Tax=Alteribacter natronophilus TaxID=2583810 RepID=UPI00110E80DC|nr:FAD-dependent oxidoreductase [Alteribacter natronophilus]TMW72152.1 CoA-disulfide reductase [Alteribacter natronophilus]